MIFNKKSLFGAPLIFHAAPPSGQNTKYWSFMTEYLHNYDPSHQPQLYFIFSAI